MAAKLKFQRVGTKNKPKYRLIVQETRTKLQGKVVEILGEYNPKAKETYTNFKKDRVEHWLKVGAQPTDSVRFLLGKAGILPPVDTTNLVKRKPKKEAQAAETAEAPKEAAAQ